MELKYGCKSTCKIDIKGCCCSKKASWNALKTQDRNDTLSKITFTYCLCQETESNDHRKWWERF